MPETPRILIIDDDRAFRVGTGALLTDEGYQVDAAPGGDAGLAQLREAHYDMVLLDLKMEGRTGLSVLEELRVSGNDVPVLMLTGYATVDSAVQALKLGADDYLTKPCDNEVLRRKIKTVLARREPVLGEGTRRMVAGTTRMREVLRAISRVAPTESTVLLRGATGTGDWLCETGAATRRGACGWAGRAGRGALKVVRAGWLGVARPDRPRRCTLPITALRVTPPSDLAIWLAEGRPATVSSAFRRVRPSSPWSRLQLSRALDRAPHLVSRRPGDPSAYQIS